MAVKPPFGNFGYIYARDSVLGPIEIFLGANVLGRTKYCLTMV